MINLVSGAPPLSTTLATSNPHASHTAGTGHCLYAVLLEGTHSYMVVKGIVLLRGCQRLCQFFDILKRTPSHIFSSYHSKSYPISYSSIASTYSQTQTQRRAMTHRQASSTSSLPSIESWQHPSDGDLLEGLKRQKWEDDSRKAVIKWTGRKPTYYKISRKKDWHWKILNPFNTKSKDSSCWILITSMVERNVIQNICKNEMWSKYWQNIQTSWHQQPYHYNALLFNSRRRGFRRREGSGGRRSGWSENVHLGGLEKSPHWGAFIGQSCSRSISLTGIMHQHIWPTAVRGRTFMLKHHILTNGSIIFGLYYYYGPYGNILHIWQMAAKYFTESKSLFDR